jgi:hypothetical protein
MKFKKAGWEAVNGTSLKGSVYTTYADLVETFGEPEAGGDKTTVEWALRFEDGTVATIYDWKTYATPMGPYDWHIGGKSKMAEVRVTQALQQTALA